MSNNSADIYFFNPTCEMAVANGNNSWQPNRLLKQLEDDLAYLPAFLAEEKDIVLCNHCPTDTFFNYFAQLDFRFPKFYTENVFLSELKEKRINPGKIIPWGQSQLVEQKFKNAYQYFPESSIYKWNFRLKDFYSREFALNVLARTIDQLPNDTYLEKNNFPVACSTIEKFISIHKKNTKSIIKLPWSSSGRGLQIINRLDVHDSILQKIKGAIKQQGKIIVELLLNKKLDFAFHFNISSESISYVGLSLFDTSAEGQYSGNYLNGFVPPDKNYYHSFLISKVDEIKHALIKALEESGIKDNYEGYIGIDGLVFEDGEDLKIQPCLEINLRNNMGILALRLEKLLHKNSHAIFRQFGPNKGGFKQLILNKKKDSPLVCMEGKAVMGVIPLTDSGSNGLFGAYLDVFEK